MGMVEDMYIRAIAKESTSIPEKQKQRIRERFTTKQLLFENHRYYCPHCKMPTPKMSNYCCNCGQKVTLEKPETLYSFKEVCDIAGISAEDLIKSDTPEIS